LLAGRHVENGHLLLVRSQPGGQKFAIGAPDQRKSLVLRRLELIAAKLEGSLKLAGFHIPDPQTTIAQAQAGQPLRVRTPE
jgi:hypothetical protein